MTRLWGRYSNDSKRFCDMHWIERKVCNLGFDLGRFLRRFGCGSDVTWKNDTSTPVYTFWLFNRVGVSHRLNRGYPVKLYAYSTLMGHARTAHEAKKVTLEWATKNGYLDPGINEVNFMPGYGWSTDFHWYGP